jgi:hypothetical protein
MGDLAVRSSHFEWITSLCGKCDKKMVLDWIERDKSKRHGGLRQVIGGARYHSRLIFENSEQLRAGSVSSLFQRNTERANVALLESWV